ncbi:MAG: deoxynucleoside kinase [Nitrospinales bacterium]
MTKPISPPRFIAVEGSIGAGKTTLSKLLAEKYDAKLVLEVDEENPFIAKFYEDKATYAFQTQIFLLLNRYNQYSELAQGELFSSMVITDYLFQRDRLFAHLNLKGHELNLYEQIYSLVAKKVPTPDLVIFLQGDNEVLQARIDKRGREYEELMDFDYLCKVNKIFNNYFFYYSETPLLVVNTNELDFIEKKFDLDDLISKINSHKIGREYYSPLGS